MSVLARTRRSAHGLDDHGDPWGVVVEVAAGVTVPILRGIPA